MTLGDRIDELLRPAVSAKRLAALRLLVGVFALVYLLARFVHLWRLSSHRAADFAPTGVVSLFDAPLPSTLYHLALLATLVLALAFTLGYRFRFTGPAFAALFLCVLSYRNSWGMVFHTENLLVLHVLVLGLSPAADAYALDTRAQQAEVSVSRRYGWPIALLSLITVTAYALAGVAKLRFGGLGWAEGEVLQNYVAMDNARKLLLGDTYSPIAAPAMQLPWIFPVLAVASLLLEVSAPLAFFWQRFARVWVLAVVGFHLGIVILMAIVFPYPLSGVAFASFFACDKLVDRGSAWLQARRRRR